MTKSQISDNDSYKKPTVIINMAAGNTLDISDDITPIFKTFGLNTPLIHSVQPHGTDLLVIYGGDGTCKAGAITAREAGIPSHFLLRRHPRGPHCHVRSPRSPEGWRYLRRG